MKQSNLSLKYMVIVILNTFTFIVGLFAFLNTYYSLAAFCLLFISLLNIYQLMLAKSDDETISISEEEDKKFEYLTKIKELTEANQERCSEIEKLKLELQRIQTKKSQITSDLYDFPLSSTTTIDLNTIFAESAERFKKMLSEKNITCTYNSTYDGRPVFLSLSAINTILKNLFDNVMKFTPRGGNVILNLANSNHGILLIIKNTSPAISPKELEHIFSLNYQGSNKQAGTGLGLAQVHAIVRDYGGSIYAKSNQDTGFTIYMELPEHKLEKLQSDIIDKEAGLHEE